jgi:hypothetical protein
MRRFQAHIFFGSGLAAAAAIYACSSSSGGNNSGPPLNEAWSDTTSSSSSGSSSGSSSSSGGSGSSSGSTEGGPAPACSSLPGTLVYIMSGDTQEPLLKLLGRQLRDSANITILFQLTGSCTLSPALYNGTPLPANTTLEYIPSTAENPNWTTADAESTCTTSAAIKPDLGISALFTTSCAGLGAPPSGIGQYNGPIQAYTMIVPTAEFTNGQTSISAAEAYYAFGDGVNNPVTLNGNPEWNDPTQFWLRPATKSTLVSTAYNIGLTPKEMTLATADGGTSDGRNLESSSTEVLSAVETSTSMQAIGILGDEVYDANRGKGVNVLAFSAFGQQYAFYPDSTTGMFDKQNIRDGHYVDWSPTVYITQVDSSGNPTNASVKFIEDLVLGNPNPMPPNGYVDGGAPIDGLGDIVKVGLTPNCAMQVQKSGDGKPLSPYSPTNAQNQPNPCTCYFLSKAPMATLPASCTTCTQSSDCTGAGAIGCFNGYCEYPPTAPTTGQAGCMVSDGTNNGIINACTSATAVQKTGLVIPMADGGLLPVNP